MTETARNGDEFWRELRARIEPGLQPLDLDEAERRLASGGEQSVSPERIDAIVGQAMAKCPRRLVAAPGLLPGRVPRGWRVAAAVLAPVLVLTAGVITVVAWPEVLDPATWRLRPEVVQRRADFAAQVAILADPTRADQERISAATSLTFDLLAIVRDLRLERDSGGMLAESARATIDLAARLARGEPIPAPLGAIGEPGAARRTMRDGSLPSPQRLDAMSRAGAALLIGIRALRDAPNPGAELREHLSVRFDRQLRPELGR
jgi:hypothetical protein